MKKLYDKLMTIKWVDIPALIVAAALWLFYFLTGLQENYLTPGDPTNIAMAKIGQFVIFYVVLRVLHLMLRRRKTSAGLRWIVTTIIFWVVYLVLLYIAWPGIWSHDDVAILKNALHYDFTPWQHFMTGLWQDICIETFLMAGGVMVGQILIAGLIMGYCVSYVAEELFLEKRTAKNITAAVLMLPAFLGPVIMYLLAGYRMGLYSFLELLLIVDLFLIFKRKEKVGAQKLFYLTLLTILVTSWRSEAIYYPIVLCVGLLLVARKEIKWWKSIVIMAIALLCAKGIGNYNTSQIGDNLYKVSATLTPLRDLVLAADEDGDTELLQDLGIFVDLDTVRNGAYGEAIIWSAIPGSVSDEAWSAYAKAYVKLCLKHPDIVYHDTSEMFRLTTGERIYYEDGTTTLRTSLSNTDNATTYVYKTDYWREGNLRHSWPFHEVLRNKFIFAITCLDWNCVPTKGFHIIWNLWIPLILANVCMIFSLLRKRWGTAGLFFCILCRIPLIILTACAPYFMYYVSFYFVGYILSLVVIIEAIGEFVTWMRKKHA